MDKNFGRKRSLSFGVPGIDDPPPSMTTDVSGSSKMKSDSAPKPMPTPSIDMAPKRIRSQFRSSLMLGLPGFDASGRPKMIVLARYGDVSRPLTTEEFNCPEVQGALRQNFVIRA